MSSLIMPNPKMGGVGQRCKAQRPAGEVLERQRHRGLRGSGEGAGYLRICRSISYSILYIK
jgi:hypothetical protein